MKQNPKKMTANEIGKIMAQRQEAYLRVGNRARSPAEAFFLRHNRWPKPGEKVPA